MPVPLVISSSAFFTLRCAVFCNDGTDETFNNWSHYKTRMYSGCMISSFGAHRAGRTLSRTSADPLHDYGFEMLMPHGQNQQGGSPRILTGVSVGVLGGSPRGSLLQQAAHGAMQQSMAQQAQQGQQQMGGYMGAGGSPLGPLPMMPLMEGPVGVSAKRSSSQQMFMPFIQQDGSLGHYPIPMMNSNRYGQVL